MDINEPLFPLEPLPTGGGRGRRVRGIFGLIRGEGQEGDTFTRIITRRILRILSLFGIMRPVIMHEDAGIRCTRGSHFGWSPWEHDGTWHAAGGTGRDCRKVRMIGGVTGSG